MNRHIVIVILAFMRTVFSRWLTREPPREQPEHLDREVPPIALDASADAEAEAFWRAAREESSPFRRDALHTEVTSALIGSAGPDLLRFCASKVRDPSFAEDLAQRAALIFWQRLPHFEDRGRLRTYLFGIALNLCRHHHREGGRSARALARYESHLGVESDVPTNEVESELEQRERVKRLEAALAQLGERDAWLLAARLAEGLSYVEILPRYRARFGAQVSTVEGIRTAFFNARRRLASHLRASDTGESP